MPLIDVMTHTWDDPPSLDAVRPGPVAAPLDALTGELSGEGAPRLRQRVGR